MKKSLPFYLVTSSFLGCVTDAKKEVAIAPKDQIEKILLGAGSNVKPQAVLDWTRKFKAQPSSQERVALENKVKIPLASASNPQEILNRAQDLSSLGFYEEAAARYKEYLRLYPTNLSGLIELVFLSVKTSQIETAFELLAQFDDSLKKVENPEPELLLQRDYAYALAYLENHDRQKAYAELSKIIGSHKDFFTGVQRSRSKLSRREQTSNG